MKCWLRGNWLRVAAVTALVATIALMAVGCSKPQVVANVTPQEAVRDVGEKVAGAQAHVRAADMQVVAITKGDTNPARAAVAHSELTAADADLTAAVKGSATAVAAVEKADAGTTALKQELDDLKASGKAADDTAWRRFRLVMVLIFALAVGGLVFWEIQASLVPRLAAALGAAGVAGVLTWAGASWLKVYWWVVAVAAVVVLAGAWAVKRFVIKKATP